MSALIGFAGDLTSLVLGFLIMSIFCWFVLSYWLDGPRLILASVAISAVFGAIGAARAPDAAFGSRGLAVLAVALVAAIVARLWLRRESQKYGPHDG